MQEKINTILMDALSIDKTKLNQNLKQIINELQNAFKNSKELILEANKIDKKNSNGFIIDLTIIDNIFENIKKEDLIYGSVTLSQKDNDKNLIYGKQIMDSGIVIVINDGNPYAIIEIILRNILAGNTTIITNNGYMYGTNQLIIQIVEGVLEQFNISKKLIQIYLTENYDDVLSNYANIDLVICIGDHNLQRLIAKKSNNRTIYSGYENFDLYIEDTTHLEFLNKIVNTGLNIQVYVNKNTEFDNNNSILVDDIDEAIAQINYNGNRYSSSIFTNSKENASKFVREVKTKIVTINTSPTIERLMDIKQADLVNEKTIVYPMNFKFNGGNNNIILNDTSII
ncbi:MAG: hypothetical protein IJE89_04985 [Bacilli bacterium]|nr:hypothetical protein [Bacilli bacterium]